MYKVDYHLHTNHSMDCDMPLTQLCETAMSLGLDEICITDHTELGHPDPESDKPPDMNALLLDIQQARERFPLVIRVGIEIGDNPLCREQVIKWHSDLPLDFRLLSLHLVDNEDPYFPETFAGKTREEFYHRYVESVLESVSAWPVDGYDAIAHLGFCAKFAPYPVELRPLRLSDARDVLEDLFLILAQNGKALEVNTSGHRKMGEFIPDREILSFFAQMGGEFVTIGSDAHRPEHVGNHCDVAQQLARECGIRYMLTFDQRKPIPVKL